jgi:hypothetical protein
MKYINEEKFLVSSNTKEAVRNYSENYDRIFGEPEPRVESGGNVMILDESFRRAVSDLPDPCGVCGATDHDRVEAFGGTVEGCPEVPDGVIVRFPPPIADECSVCLQRIGDGNINWCAPREPFCVFCAPRPGREE